MERSRRQPPGGKRAARPSAPATSRLAFGASRNKRRARPLSERLPRPIDIADGCGRLVRRAAPGLIAVTAAGVLCGGAWLAHHFVTTSQRFALASVEVRGAHRLDPASVRALVTVAPGQNLFSINLGAVEATVAADPWIARARVHRELPHTLVIDVTEEQPAAAVDLDGLYLTSRDGQPFKRALIERGEASGLPIITGVGRDVFQADPDGAAALVAHALDAADAWRLTEAAPGAPARPGVGEIHVDSRRGVTLFTRDGAVAIRLGELDGDSDRLGARLRSFDAAWAALAPDERRRARAVHLDNRTRPDHVTVAFVN